MKFLSKHALYLDNFRTQAEEVRQLKKIAPVIALDEGGEGRAFADYLIDILPTLPIPLSCLTYRRRSLRRIH